MSVCYIGDMLTKNLGESLFSGARLAIRFVDILWPNMEISVVGGQAEQPVSELGRQRYAFDLEVQDPTGRVTVIADGSYAVDRRGGSRLRPLTKPTPFAIASHRRLCQTTR